ncbi:hypothetical protein SBA1_1340021 [Candidatus Sulfotelmatobacter kueseliae]|uniref:Uncharacterized protein n=1 Tax=Candidatus Sulfotelmatobacter kueseliae TaxID=2042962 RepID=A0A2U3K5A3_9BACT|nr:hypothetical protein SBA1_1340021 [Candidatus Sulfotelmatobacter kueseliae]
MKTVIQLAALAVSAVTLFYLIKYVRATQVIAKSAIDQVEGMSKPCLILWGELRDGNDAILNMDGAVGNIIAAADHGSYVVKNIGSGVALNVQYRFTRPDDDPVHPREMRYIPTLEATGRAALVETIGGYNAEHEVTFEYESIGRRKYRTTIQLNHRVITSFGFKEIKL